jgi:Zn-dependent protease with chaperone function/uncharacterized tellurite resistance protein B-like protein
VIRSIAIAAGFGLLIPVIGYLTGNWILNDLNAQFNGTLIEQFCATQINEMSGKEETACQTIIYIDWMRTASFWCGVASLSLLLMYLSVSTLIGTNRRFISIVFPLLVPLTTISLAILILVQGIILTYAAWQGEIHAIGRVHYILIGGIGLAAAIGSLSLLDSIFTLKIKLVSNVVGKQIDQQEYIEIWNFVKRLASTLKSREPDNLVVGLEPTFYVTSADINIVNEGCTLKGETLYLSLPLMRLFTSEELEAVIGHELGHFRGNDTAYTLKFAPIYAGLKRSIGSLDDSITALPAISMLSAMFDIFSKNEKKISRIREFEADQAGVSVSSEKDLALALAKVAIFSSLWSKVREDNVERLNSGKIVNNLSEVFEDSAKYDVAHSGLDELITTILETQITHPTDTHPSIRDRYKSINYDESDLTVKSLIELGQSSEKLFSSTLGGIEQELTVLEHRVMVALGHVKPPEDEEKRSDSILNALYILAATMIGADGKIEQNEIKTAENIGKQLNESFDEVEFRAFCKDLNSLPSFADVIDLLSNAFEKKELQIIYDYLRDIANADGEISEEETNLLLMTRAKFNLEV